VKSLKTNRKNSVKEEKTTSHSPRGLDSLDIQIVDELLADANISSTKIASKYNVPLSTIQRRRAKLESVSILGHKYQLNPLSFGLRPVQFWVMVEGGKAEEVAKEIFGKYYNVLRATVQMNALSNVGVLAYFNSSEEVFSMLEGIKSIKFVNRVEFAEIVKIVDERQTNFFKKQDQYHTS